MAAVRQHLHGQLPASRRSAWAEQRVVGEEHREPGERLQVLDEVVAADIGFQVAAQEPSVRREFGAELASMGPPATRSR